MGNRQDYNQQFQTQLDQNMRAQQSLQASRVEAQNGYSGMIGYSETPQYYGVNSKQKQYSQIQSQLQGKGMGMAMGIGQQQSHIQSQPLYQSQILPQVYPPQGQNQRTSKIENNKLSKPQFTSAILPNPTPSSNMITPPLQNSRIVDPIRSSILAATIRLKDAVETLVNTIQKDLPHKGWKTLINKPTSKYYLAVVTSGLQDPETMKRYNELEASISNPEVLRQIANEEMHYSKSRKINVEQTTEQTAKKLIQGPAHYRTTEMRGTKYPTK